MKFKFLSQLCDQDTDPAPSPLLKCKASSRQGGEDVDMLSSQGIQAPLFFPLAPLYKITTNGDVPRSGFLLVVGSSLLHFRDPYWDFFLHLLFPGSGFLFTSFIPGLGALICKMDPPLSQGKWTWSTQEVGRLFPPAFIHRVIDDESSSLASFNFSF